MIPGFPFGCYYFQTQSIECRVFAGFEWFQTGLTAIINAGNKPGAAYFELNFIGCIGLLRLPSLSTIFTVTNDRSFPSPFYSVLSACKIILAGSPAVFDHSGWPLLFHFFLDYGFYLACFKWHPPHYMQVITGSFYLMICH